MPSSWESLKNQIYLGSDQFVNGVQCKMDHEQSLKDIAKLHKQAPAKPLEYYESSIDNIKIAMATAYLDGHYTLQEVGEHFAVSYATVSRAVKMLEM